jgi:predicted Abi (CAAX) family protease
VFSLLVAGPLYGDKTSAKIAAITLGIFGIIYHGLLAGLLLGSIAPPDIESSFLVAAGLLLVAVVVMGFNFWSAAKTE